MYQKKDNQLLNHISFQPLHYNHFALLHVWLEKPHVKQWWDKDVVWTRELIYEKYSSYVNGYKLVNGEKKTIHAYIICFDKYEIGYIQYYNAHDFFIDGLSLLKVLPYSLASLDLFIGEEQFVGKGLGAQALVIFLEKYIDFYYSSCLVEVASDNMPAIRAYEKAGFRMIKACLPRKTMLMVRDGKKDGL